MLGYGREEEIVGGHDVKIGGREVEFAAEFVKDGIVVAADEGTREVGEDTRLVGTLLVEGGESGRAVTG